MSLILDALNRADKDRQQVEQVPSISSPLPSDHPQRKNLLWRWVIEILLVVIVILLLYFVLRSDDEGDTSLASLPQTTVVSSPVIEKPKVATVNQPVKVNVSIDSVKETAADKVGAQVSNEEIQALYNKSDDVSSEQKFNSVNTSNLQSEPEAVSKPVNQQDEIYRTIPLASELSRMKQQLLPSIEYTTHIYNNENGSGMVVLNGETYRRGDRVADNLVLLEIEKDYIVLDYDGMLFRLLSLNSWINF